MTKLRALIIYRGTELPPRSIFIISCSRFSILASGKRPFRFNKKKIVRFATAVRFPVGIIGEFGRRAFRIYTDYPLRISSTHIGRFKYETEQTTRNFRKISEPNAVYGRSIARPSLPGTTVFAPKWTTTVSSGTE